MFVLGSLALGPALAYPPGDALAISCDATTYAPSATAVCTLTNIVPGGPHNIELGGRLGAQGDGVTIVLASLSAQDADANTYVQDVPLPAETGTYEVIGTSGGETATTTVQVVAAGAVEPFSVVVQPDGSVLVQNATPGCSVTVYVNDVAVGSGVADENGSVTIAAKAPAGATVRAEQTASDNCAALESDPVVVGSGTGGSGSTTDKATTPKTGANVTLGVVAGLGALGLGGGLYVASRRKKV